jgi:hypothetical protein
MIAATTMPLPFTPVFYVVTQRLSELRGRSQKREGAQVTEQTSETV